MQCTPKTELQSKRLHCWTTSFGVENSKPRNLFLMWTNKDGLWVQSLDSTMEDPDYDYD